MSFFSSFTCVVHVGQTCCFSNEFSKAVFVLFCFQPDSKTTAVLKAEDKMDDGSDIKVTISISKEDGVTTVDFTGTGKQVCFYNYTKQLHGCKFIKTILIIVNSLNFYCIGYTHD